MALSRMFKLNEICYARNYVVSHCPRVNNFTPKNVRTFKRGHQEEKKPFESLASPFHNVAISEKLTLQSLMKPLGFTVTFCSLCFGGAAIWQYESMRAHALKMLKQPVGYVQKKTQEAQRKTNDWLRNVEEWWHKLTPGEKVFFPICAANVLVFCAWRIPNMQPFMLRYFCSNPGSQSVCLPMLLSTFSHYSAFHLLANMYVLHSFSTGAVASLGKEQFLGLYLGAGVVSSFTSYFYKTMTKQTGLSLGASGAIMAILGYVCTQYPDTKLGVIFLPFLTFSAGSAIKAIVALDAAGVLLGWKIFDHAAHLGGAACGVAWAYWGNEHLWHKRDPLLQYWHEIRGAIK